MICYKILVHGGRGNRRDASRKGAGVWANGVCLYACARVCVVAKTSSLHRAYYY